MMEIYPLQMVWIAKVLSTDYTSKISFKICVPVSYIIQLLLSQMSDTNQTFPQVKHNEK